jgi:pimeloyl-ACP methyl ester carboxylesterase
MPQTMTPGPVILVPGWSDRGRVLHHLRDHLVGEGWPTVRVIDFADRYGSNVVHAEELARAIHDLRRTGFETIDVVAHSMGGLAVRHYLNAFGDKAMIRTVVFLATPHRGTLTARIAWGKGAREMRPGSSFLRALNATQLPEAVRAFTVRMPIDFRVLPGASARLPGAHDAVVRFATHRGLVRNRTVYSLIRSALLQELPGPSLASTDPANRLSSGNASQARVTRRLR